MKNKLYSQASILTAMILAIFMLNIELTSTYVILAPLAKQLYLTSSELAWVVSTYLLSFAATITIGGRLGDLHGHRNILLLGLSIFAAASLLGGFSNNLSSLMISRTGQGIGAALLWPNATVIILNTFPKNKSGSAISLTTSIVGLSLAFGPVIGGIITNILSWRWVFWFNTPLALLAFIATYCFMRNEKSKCKTRIDYLGAILIAAISICLILSIKQVTVTAPWHHDLFIFTIAGIILFALFWFYEKKIDHAILPASLRENKSFIFSCCMRALMVMPFYVILMVMALFLQKNLHLTPFHAGLAFMPMTLTIGLFSPIGGRLIDFLSARLALLIAGIIYLLGFTLLYFFIQASNAITLSSMLILPGIAFSLATSAALTMGLAATPRNLKGTATGVFYMVSIISGLISVTICSIVIAHSGPSIFITKRAMSDILLISLTGSLIVVLANLKKPANHPAKNDSYVK